MTLLALSGGACNDTEPLDPTSTVEQDRIVANAPAHGKRESVLDRIDHLQTELVSEVPQAPRPDATVKFREQRIDVGNAELYVQEQGRGTPLVLIPGGPGNSLQSFHPHFSRAADFSRVIYFDPRGTGQSDWEPGNGYSAQQAVEDLEQLRQALSVEQWVILGHSFGGLLAQLYTIHYPERVAGLVLVSTSVAMPIEETDDRTYMSEAEKKRIRAVYSDGVRTVIPIHTDAVDLPMVRKLLYNAFLNGEWKRQYFYKPSQEKMAQVALYEWVHDKNYTPLVNQSGFAYDLDGAFEHMPIPTLIVEGKWDPHWEKQKPYLLQAQIPNSLVLVLERSSHFSFAEEPERFFLALHNFINELEPISSTSIVKWKKHLAPWIATSR